MNKINSIFIFFILLNSCSKNNNMIPNVPVNFRIQASELGGVGSAIYTETEYGIRGIIIYHYNTNEYIAYERACSFKPSDNCESVQLNNEKNPSYLVDKCCNSKFLIENGIPFDGPALRALKQYYTEFDGTYINISN